MAREFMQSIAINGVARFFDEEGEGPTVILIHGSLSSSRQWRKLTERLRNRFRLISPDLYVASHDGATPRIGEFSFADDCNFIRQLIDDRGGAHVVGHSWGGVIAAKAAFGRREAVASLTLIEPSCFHLLEKPSAEFAEIIGVHERQRELITRGELAEAARLFVEYWMGPSAFTRMPPQRQRPIIDAIPRLHCDWAGTLDDNTALGDYRNWKVRTLLMMARDTRQPSARIIRILKEILPAVETAEIDSGGHMSPLTNPEPVNAALDAFLSGMPR